MDFWENIKTSFWRFPLLPEKKKESFYYFVRSLIRGKTVANASNANTIDGENVYCRYTKQVLAGQSLNNQFSVNYPTKPRIELTSTDVKLVAYYLPQYYPDPHNTHWWGKGSTEWTNTTKATAQYIGQYQPRLPGELGFYDLRIEENIRRQVELAKFFGIYGFCFYYYWFDGERLLDLPLNRYVEDPKIDFPFFICWVNESWTKQWSSSSDVILMEQKHTTKSYKAFIHSALPLFTKSNYMRIDGRPILNVYRSYAIKDWKVVINYWREAAKREIGTDLYIIGCLTKEKEYDVDYLAMGFDAVNEFSLSANSSALRDITKEKQYVTPTFLGKVYDYPEFVREKKYFRHTAKKLHRAVVTGFDNTARKVNKGIIFDGATPKLYGSWLADAIVSTAENDEIDEKLLFLFAWNEWAEGAYLEPDLKFQYGYLEATANAVIEARSVLRSKFFIKRS